VSANSVNAELENRIRHGTKRQRVQAIRELVKTTDVNNETKVEILLSSLAEEISKPESGQLIENGYVSEEEFFKRQYMSALADAVKNNLPIIKKHLEAIKRDRFSNKRKESVEWQERTSLILGMLGEKKVLADIRKILIQSKDGNIRQTAAHVIKSVGDKQAIPQLKIALNDPYQVSYKMPSETRTIYPVRAKAAAALIKLGVYVDFKGNGEYLVPSTESDRK
jgi:HEAT repeat protein